MPPQAPPPGPPGPGRPPASYPGARPPGPPDRNVGPPRPAGPGAPPPRPPVQSVYGPGGPNRMATPPPTRASRMAVVALVLAVLVAPVGLVLGVVARRRIRASERGGFEHAFERTAFERTAFGQEAPERLTGRGRATAAVVLGVVLTLLEIGLVVALTVGIPTNWLPSSDVTATEVQTQIEQATKLPAGSVRCPGSLPATVGATIACTGTENGRPVTLTARVSTVQGRDVRFDVTRG